MDNLSKSIHAWLKPRVNLPTANDRYIIDKLGFAAISDATFKEIASAGIQLPLTATDDLKTLLSLFLIDERDPERALVGNIAVELSPVNVAGAILAIIGLLSWVTGGAGLVTGESALVIAGAAQATVAAVSRLSPEERSIISTVLSLSHLRILSIVTSADIIAASRDSNLSPTMVVTILSRLREKSVISWSGEENGAITVKKWF
jgi:hypothetical protein